jgi:hypothetical protein
MFFCASRRKCNQTGFTLTEQLPRGASPLEDAVRHR